MNCRECKFAKILSHTHHIGCCNPDFNLEGNERAISKGWFNYPFEFDPIWIIGTCNNYINKSETIFSYVYSKSKINFDFLLERQKNATLLLSVSYDSKLHNEIEELIRKTDDFSYSQFKYVKEYTDRDKDIINGINIEEISDFKKCYNFLKNLKDIFAKV